MARMMQRSSCVSSRLEIAKSINQDYYSTFNEDTRVN